MKATSSITAALLGLAACGRGEPPGVEQSKLREVRELSLRHVPSAASAGSDVVLGSEADNLPFTPDGTKLASIAWRTWVYTDIGERRRRYGYLRAGAVVDARGPALVNAGCKLGWYRVNPVGFVCVGKGATLDLEHELVRATGVRPRRDGSLGWLPYLYARAAEPPPHRYFRLPTAAEMQSTEGDYRSRALHFLQRAAEPPLSALLGQLTPPPDFVRDARKLPKPYGVKRFLHYAVHAGKTAQDAGFAVANTFVHEQRAFGLTTELDLIALDRTKVVVPSKHHGVALAAGQDLPIGFVVGSAPYYEQVGTGFRQKGSLVARTAVAFTGKKAENGAYAELPDGTWVMPAALRLVEKRTSFPSFATGRRKWIDVSIQTQTLLAFEGTKLVYATLVSTGRGGLGDPEKSHATIRGTFMVHSKHVTATMDGEDDQASDSYNLLDVPFVQYFHKGYALHGTYWHDDFGKVRSHGCINLAPEDAAWLFAWTDPKVFDGWHGRLNLDRGTVVSIHP